MPSSNKTAETVRHETLGDNVIPVRYFLRFKPNFVTFKYDGSARIEVQIRKGTKEIVLNAAELSIKDAHVESSGKRVKAVIKVDKPRQRIGLRLGARISGKATIYLEFTGINNDLMYGFYRSKYYQGKAVKYILTSQFEAANARNAFPCFDEPEFKAVFDVTMVVDRDLECISNMPVMSIRKAGKKKEVRFMETPRMSTYLLYLGVGKYDSVRGRLGKLEVRVVTTPGNRKLASLPLEYARKFIRFFEGYFGVKYPLPKVDFIAIPDFAAGAMENWGAITFRETALLVGTDSSIATKQRVAEVIAHELTHQWFGDLVTMKWWNDLWLNESFATFMSYKAMDAVFPEWKMPTEYKRSVIATALGADQLKSTHPISVPVNSPAEIDQLFDEISYEKGGSVLNMIEDYAGKQVFRQGLHRYLKKHSYSNATKFDLWRSIDGEARRRRSGVKVYDVASFWINKPGYPIIHADRSSGAVTLQQERYFILNNASDSTVWPIPVTYSADGAERKMLLDKKSATLSSAAGKWLKLNYGQNGFYRVSYDPGDIEKLGLLIREKRISGVDAWGIENDVFAASRSGRSSASAYLDFVDRYCFGAEYPLNANVLGHMGWIYDMLGSDDGRCKELIIRYSNEIIGKLGWKRKNTESTFDTMMRSAAIMKSGTLGYGPTVDRAREMLDGYIKRGKTIETNLRSAIFYINAWHGDDSVFAMFRERYLKENVPEEKIRFLKALAMFNDRELMLKAFDLSMSKEVRLQDAYILAAIGSSNPAGSKLILGWTEENWKQLKKMFASGTHMLGRYVENLAVLKSRQDLAEVRGFFANKGNMRGDLTHALRNTLEEIEANVQFMEANRQSDLNI
jgi:tricorn protease interacting factor F2/3